MADEFEFKDASETMPLIEEIMQKYFPSYDLGLLRPYFYYKEKKIKGRTAMAYIRRSTEFEKCLLKSKDIEYILMLDGNIWPELHDEDRKRLVRHELRHIYIDFDKEGEPKYGISDHDLIDFRDDYKLEHGVDYEDPFLRASNTAMEVYFRINEEKKKAKQKQQE